MEKSNKESEFDSKIYEKFSKEDYERINKENDGDEKEDFKRRVSNLLRTLRINKQGEL